ncbi:MFS transporter [Kribbella jejuensis]|uniref:Nitrate/nitrite transporter NarK n=1 Tax=Kribbella jejuensis TaxID=236068 RepID=A0A542EQ57_9ACTN|nr:MFS transporter [Kribbella jejuensis]TQJ17473.1 nitrate/nitrite transporter NarK [Kribbella jejuensis]
MTRDFRWLLVGQTTSQFGAQVSGVAIPLLAVLSLGATPFQLGLVSASSTIGFALIGLPAGAWIDRFRRRPLLVASDLVRAVLLGSIPMAALFGVLTLIQLIVVALLTGFARVFFDVGYQSYLPSVVGKERVLAGNAALETIRASGQVAGPGAGGWLVSAIGAANVVLIQAVTFVVSAVALLAIRAPEEVVRRESRGLWHEIREGLVYVVRHPVLRAIAVTSAVNNFAFAIASAVNLVFLVRTLRLTPAWIGVVLAAGSATAMLGAAVTPRLARRFGSERIIWGSLVVAGVLGLLVPLAQPGWFVVLAIIGFAAGELGQIVYAISSVSLRQRIVPARLLGRVGATMRFVLMGLFPLGALLGGVAGSTIGPRGTLWISGALIAVSWIPVRRAFSRSRGNAIPGVGGRAGLSS